MAGNNRKVKEENRFSEAEDEKRKARLIAAGSEAEKNAAIERASLIESEEIPSEEEEKSDFYAQAGKAKELLKPAWYLKSKKQKKQEK